MKKTTLGILSIVIGILLGIFLIIDAVYAKYQYTNTILASWNLSDKASTIEQKSQYINQFEKELSTSGLQGTNQAVFLPTNDTAFDTNLQALQSLQSRLDSIQGMDENSFQYQTAIQQITAQEQGEAQNMLAVFQGCWNRVHHYLLWNWVTVTLWILISIGFIIFGIVELNNDNY